MKKYMVLLVALLLFFVPVFAEEPARIDLSAEQDVIFFGMDTVISAVAYTKDGAPVSAGISLSTEDGTMHNGVFVPNKVGVCRVEAVLGDVTASLDITVLSHPTALRVTPRNVCLAVGEEAELSFMGYASDGTGVSIPYRFIHAMDEEITFENGTMRLLSGKGRTVDFFFRGTETVLGLDVKTDKRTYLKLQSAEFYGFPEGVEGSVQKKTDALLLYYQFQEALGEEQTAYLVFSKPITMDDNKKKVYVSIESPTFSDVVCRANLVDTNGRTFRPVFCETLPAGKKEASFYIPEEAARPVRLTRLSVELLSPKNMEGSLTVSSIAVEPDTEVSYTPKPPLLMPDAAYVEAEGEKLAFAFGGNTMLGGLAKQKLKNRHANTFVASDSDFYMQKQADYLFFYSGTKRLTAEQTQMIRAQAASAETCVVILMKQGVLSDAEEAVLLTAMQKAAQDKCVFYITEGAQSESLVLGGVRYLTLATPEALLTVGGVPSVLQQMQYVCIVPGSGSATYQFKNIWE